MAITMPVYIDCDRQNVGDPGGSGSDFPGTPVAIKSGTLAVSRGLLLGVRATCSASAGTMTVKVYSDVSKTDELYNQDLTMSASPFKDSHLLEQGVPFFSAPYFQINNSADPNAAIYVTFYVKAIAGNS